ncbi:MAG: hypothetical protein KDB16_15885, partial [Acidimicrobiales bacterium]|nr:hypothetical protein [Acidimicrobiales bacterium]
MAVGRPRNHCSNPRLLLVALVVTLTAALLLAVDSRSAQASAALQGRTVFGPLVPPGDRVLVGAYVEARGDFTDADRRASVEAHEASIGRPLDIVNEFFSFSKPWAMDRLAWHIEQGRTPMVSWNGTHADDILAGRHDELIRERARDAKQLEVTFLLRFFWEMDAAKGRNWGYHDDPTLYHRVWNHVRTIFDQEGVDNAVWVWTPTTWHFTTGKAAEFYPGDDVVDWIGADGYQWSCTGDGLDSFGAVYRDFLTWAAGKNKPVIAAEWGADESPAKVPFIQSVPEVLAGYPNIVALVAFDSIDPGGRGCNFRIDTSAAALQAYRALVNDAPFVPSTPTTTLLIPETSVTTVVPTTV